MSPSPSIFTFWHAIPISHFIFNDFCIYRQFSVFTTSVGLTVLALINPLSLLCHAAYINPLSAMQLTLTL